MGRPLSVRVQRFRHIPYNYGAALYVVEFADGVVKVGCSQNPARRLPKLECDALRERGCGIARFHVGAPVRALRKLESALIRRMAAVSTPVPGFVEYFSGANFVQAAFLLEEVCEAEAKFLAVMEG